MTLRTFLEAPARIMEEELLKIIPDDYTVKIMGYYENNYLRIGVYPELPKEILKEYKQKFHLKLKTYTGEDGMIIEFTKPKYDLILRRNLEAFPDYNSYYLDLIQYDSYNTEYYGIGFLIATFAYNPSVPFGEQLAVRTLMELLRNEEEYLDVDFEDYILNYII